jgi:N-acetylneuraminic acid mutarotase
LVWGGVGAAGHFDDGFIYDVEANTWEEISSVDAPTARERHTAVWTGEKMLIWGGIDADGLLLSTGGVYDLETDTWEEMAAAPISARFDHVAVWTDEYMFIWGGEADTGTNGEGAVYSPAVNAWFIVSDLGITPRVGHRAVWTGDFIFLFSGWDGRLSSFGPGENKYRNNGVIVSW